MTEPSGESGGGGGRGGWRGSEGQGIAGLKVMYLVRGIESQRGEEEALTVCDLG